MQMIDAEALWQQYRDDRAPATLNALLTTYLPIVEANARKVCSTLPASTDVDDLIQAGTLGLRQAIEAFHEGHGAKFETFAWTRVRGAMLDELRRMDWLPRRRREQLARAGSGGIRLNLDDVSAAMADTKTVDAADEAERRDFWPLIARRLTSREYLLIRLHADEHMNIPEISRALGWGRSRTAQILGNVRTKLRAQVASWRSV